MNLRYSLRAETYKPAKGSYLVANPGMLDDAVRSLELDCARGDTLAAVLALCPDEDMMLCLSDGAAFTPSGKLPRIRIKAPGNEKMNIILLHPGEDGFLHGDALDTAPRCEVKANETVAVYLEIEVSKNTEPGNYINRFGIYQSVMFEDEKLIGNVNIEYTVHDFVMPEKKDFKFHLDIWQHNCAVARAHGVEPWSDEHFAILEEYVKSLADLGQKAVSIITTDCAWSGQWCHLEYRNRAELYEYSIIRADKHPDGHFEYDYTAMQRYIDLCAKYHIDREITIFGLVNVWCDWTGGFDSITPDYPDGPKIRYRDLGDNGCFKYMRKAEEVEDFITSLEQYFVKTGQIDRVRLLADEPADIERYRKSIDSIKEIAPEFILKAAINHAEFIAEFGDRTNDFVPNLGSLSKEYDRMCEFKETMPDKRFLWYVCNQPANPNTMFKNDLCESLFIGVVTALFRMDGFLRWGYTVWCEEPVKDNRYFTWPTGDLNFVYPAKSGRPMLSLRYKALKRAVELCELINILREKKGDAVADKAFEYVVRANDVREFFVGDDPIPTADMCSLDYKDYADMRKYILCELEK